MYACMHVCTYAHVYVCLHTHVCVVSIYIYVYIDMYVSIYTSTHLFVATQVGVNSTDVFLPIYPHTSRSKSKANANLYKRTYVNR